MLPLLNPLDLTQTLQQALVGIQVKVTVRNQHLFILLEYTTALRDPSSALQVIYSRLSSYRTQGLTQVKIFGRIVGQHHPQWQKVFSLPIQDSSSVVTSLEITPTTTHWLHAIPRLFKKLWDRVPAFTTTGHLNKLYRKGLYALSQGDLEKATLTFNSIIELRSTEALAYCYLGQSYLKQKDFFKAIQSYWSAKRLNYDSGDFNLESELIKAYVLYARQLIQAGEYSEAMIQLQIAESLDPPSLSDQALVQRLLGRLLSHLRQWDSAIAAFKIALQCQPTHVGVLSDYGWVLSCKGDQDGAIATYTKALSLNSSLSLIHHRLGIALLKRGDLRQAMGEYHKALTLTSQPDPTLRADMGMALLLSGQMTRAVQEIQLALTQSSTCAKAHMARGCLLALQGEYSQATQHFEQSLDLDPNLLEASAHIGLVQLLSREHRDVSHASIMKKSIHSRQIEQITVQFEKVLSQDSNIAEAHFGLGEVYRLRGNVLFAMRSYQAAINANGSFVDAYFKLGTLSASMGRTDRAIESFRATLQLNSHYPDARINLEKLLSRHHSKILTPQTFK